MKKGFALTSLIVFTTMGLMVLATSIYMLTDAFTLTSQTSLSEEVSQLAQSGAEEAQLKLLRYPKTYTGENLYVNTDKVVITVTGTSTKTILSSVTKYGIIKSVQIIK